MHGFGQVDDAEERWRMGFEKVVRQTVLRLVLTIVSSWYLLHSQSDPTSEGGVHDKMEYFRTLYPTSLERNFQPTLSCGSGTSFLHANVGMSNTSSRICRTQDIAIDTKDLDKLLLKYARALVDKDGSW